MNPWITVQEGNTSPVLQRMLIPIGAFVFYTRPLLAGPSVTSVAVISSLHHFGAIQS